MNRIVTSESTEATERLGATVGKSLSGGAVLALYGDLGAGKSVFARGLARGLGIVDPVTSPTFALVQEYICPDGRRFVHADMYRLHDTEDAVSTGLTDHLFAPNTIVAVEWAERIHELFQPAAEQTVPLLCARFEHVGTGTRTIRLETV